MTSLYTKFIANIIFPLQEYLKKHSSVRRRGELEQSQWLPLSSLQQQQAEKLPMSHPFPNSRAFRNELATMESGERRALTIQLESNMTLILI